MATTPENTKKVQSLLREYGEAIRGSWADIDGRSVRSDLADISNALDATEPIDMTWYRNMLDICPFGYGHWTEFCDNCETYIPG